MAEGSILLLEECFASGDPRFLDELHGLDAPKKLGAFAERWFKDSRPWARERLREYLDLPIRLAGHKPLVKRLFKLAEAAADDRAMGWFIAAFDRSCRRRAVKTWDFQARQPGERLALVRRPPHPFKAHTRHYLRRRAWRYFRRLGHRDPKRYLAAILPALLLYRDEDCDGGVHFLDNWGLVHALFHHSDVLSCRTHGWFVRPGRALRELKPAPAFPAAWEANASAPLDLLLGARARPVRRAATAMIRERPGLFAKLPVDRLAALFEHPDEEVQALGAELLRTAAGIESAPADLWLRLLEGRSLPVLEAVCEVMARAVSPDRFSTAQLLALACVPLGPPAALAVAWLKSRDVPAGDLAALAGVRAASAARAAVALARERMSAAPGFDPGWLMAFLDSTTREVREAAWEWFAAEARACRRVDLWTKLVESPYDDVRIAIVRHLERYASADRAVRVLLARAPLETVWATVLLNIHRGGRAKRMAASQVAEAIERDPARAAGLLPLLAAAARSIRPPEFRAGLAAVVRAATRRPEVAEQVGRHFPELKLVP
jgi:hypothetical protein